MRGWVSTIGVNSFDIVTLRPITTSHLRDNGIRNENRRREDTAETRAQGKPNLFLYSTQLNKYAVLLTINTILNELF